MPLFSRKPSGASVPADRAAVPSGQRPLTIVSTDSQHYDSALSGAASSRVKLVLGYINPSANLEQVGRAVARHFPHAQMVLTTTAGELCSLHASDNLYLPSATCTWLRWGWPARTSRPALPGSAMPSGSPGWKSTSHASPCRFRCATTKVSC